MTNPMTRFSRKTWKPYARVWSTPRRFARRSLYQNIFPRLPKEARSTLSFSRLPPVRRETHGPVGRRVIAAVLTCCVSMGAAGPRRFQATKNRWKGRRRDRWTKRVCRGVTDWIPRLQTLQRVQGSQNTKHGVLQYRETGETIHQS